MRLENSVFTELATGTLSGGAFYIGTAAHDASDRIIYNKTTGALSYDFNGNGPAARGAVRHARPTGWRLTKPISWWFKADGIVLGAAHPPLWPVVGRQSVREAKRGGVNMKCSILD